MSAGAENDSPGNGARAQLESSSNKHTVREVVHEIANANANKHRRAHLGATRELIVSVVGLVVVQGRLG